MTTYGVWQGNIVNTAGDVQPAAQLAVYIEGGGLAVIYGARDGAGGAIGNPITADASGFVRFYAPAGAHRLVATKGGQTLRTWRYVPIGTGGESDLPPAPPTLLGATPTIKPGTWWIEFEAFQPGIVTREDGSSNPSFTQQYWIEKLEALHAIGARELIIHGVSQNVRTYTEWGITQPNDASGVAFRWWWDDVSVVAQPYTDDFDALAVTLAACSELGIGVVIGLGQHGDVNLLNDTYTVSAFGSGGGSGGINDPMTFGKNVATRTTEEVARYAAEWADILNRFEGEPSLVGGLCSHEPAHLQSAASFVASISAIFKAGSTRHARHVAVAHPLDLADSNTIADAIISLDVTHLTAQTSAGYGYNPTTGLNAEVGLFTALTAKTHLALFRTVLDRGRGRTNGAKTPKLGLQAENWRRSVQGSGTLTISNATVGTGRTVTASVASFVVGDVGKALNVRSGMSTGLSTITGYTSATVVTVTTTEAWQTVGPTLAGFWAKSPSFIDATYDPFPADAAEVAIEIAQCAPYCDFIGISGEVYYDPATLSLTLKQSQANITDYKTRAASGWNTHAKDVQRADAAVRFLGWNMRTLVDGDTNHVLLWDNSDGVVGRYVAGTPALLRTFVGSGLTQGSVVFAGASGALTEDNAGLFFDDTYNRLGINTAIPGNGFSGLGAITEAGVDIVAKANANVTVLRLIHAPTSPSAVREIAMEFGVTNGASGGQSFSGARLYAVANASPSFATNRFTIQTPTNIGTWADVMSFVGTGVGIGTQSPNSGALVHMASLAGRLDITQSSSINDYVRLLSTVSNNSWALRIRDQVEGDFGIRDTTAGAYRLYFDNAGNIVTGGATAFGTSAAKVFGMANGTEPSTSPADMIQLYAKDLASSAEYWVRNEAGDKVAISRQPGIIVGGYLAAVNFNSTADQAITIKAPFAKYRVQGIKVYNASGDLSATVGGVYTAASKGGTAVIPAATSYFTVTDATSTQSTAGINGPGSYLDATTNNTLYFSLTTPQGAARTATVELFIECLVP